jgi:transposase InsO family protein
MYTHATHLDIPKPRISKPAKHFSDEVHSDMWGATPVATCQGHRYFVTFTDDATRFTIVYLLRTTDEVLETYKSFETWALTQKHCKAINVPRSDRRGEYLSGAFDNYLAMVGTARKLTMHNTPQLNGIAEWLSCTLLERVRALEYLSGLPKSLWGEALWHTTWLKYFKRLTIV